MAADTNSRAGSLPTSITHEISSSSPIFGLQSKEFSVDVHVKAFDEKLGEIVHGTHLYTSDNILIGCEWDNPFIISPKAALSDPNMIITVDASKMSSVRAISSTLLHKMDYQLRKNRAAKDTSIKNRRRRNFTDLAGRQLESIIKSPNVTTLKEILNHGKDIAHNDATNEDERSALRTAELYDYDHDAEQKNVLSPVSALTSPSYSPMPVKQMKSSTRTKLFNFSNDMSGADAGGIVDLSNHERNNVKMTNKKKISVGRKKYNFLFFKK